MGVPKMIWQEREIVQSTYLFLLFDFPQSGTESKSTNFEKKTKKSYDLLLSLLGIERKHFLLAKISTVLISKLHPMNETRT